MNIQNDVPLAPLTSLGVGGNAEQLITIEENDAIASVIRDHQAERLWFLGYGTNSLISDKGLPGITLLIRGGRVIQEDTMLIADSGVWWDDIVKYTVTHNLWGLELMSAIPGGVGAAVVGNIAAYGQAVSNTLGWIEVIDSRNSEISRITPDKLKLDYRYSAFQDSDFAHLIITRVAFHLSHSVNTDLTYQSALDVVEQGHYDVSSLSGRRQAIIHTREIAGSLWDYRDKHHDSKNVGSFFRNPLVSPDQADNIMRFDETGKSTNILKEMNRVHSGNEKRVSAALVLLAAGFKRGQTWGPVRLHPQHVLKIENTGNATAKQIYDVAQEIIATVKSRLGIELIPEARFLGDF